MSGQDQNMRKAIRQLPAYKAPAQVWDKIADELDHEAPLMQAIDEYKHETRKAPDLFDQVITQTQPRQKTKLIPNSWLSGIAAGLALLMMVYWSMNEPEEQVTVTSYTEVAADLPESITAVVQELSEEDEVMDFIKTHCEQVALTCNTPKFQGLFGLYLELDQSKSELLDVMEQNHNRQELTSYLIRVEKEKDDVGKQLIQMIIG